MSARLLTRFRVEGLCPEGALKKLSGGNIPLFGIKKTGKTQLEFCIERKYRKKAFTILKDSCYNITETRYYGVLRLMHALRSRAGAAVGCALFLLVCSFSSRPVLRIDVSGTGAYYRREIVDLLGENGVKNGGVYDERKTPLLTAKILALPDVSFCSLKKSGNVLRVEVQVVRPAEFCARTGSLCASTDGKVVSVRVLRGEAKVREETQVTAGDVLVAETDGAVMASVTLECRYGAFFETESEESAFAAGMLALGEVWERAEIEEKTAVPTDGGFNVEIRYLLAERMNM